MSPSAPGSTAFATLTREVRMFLGLPPYDHDKNRVRGNAMFLDQLTERYGATILRTTMARLSKEHARAVQNGDVPLATPLDSKTGRTLGDTVDDALTEYRQRNPQTMAGQVIPQHSVASPWPARNQAAASTPLAPPAPVASRRPTTSSGIRLVSLTPMDWAVLLRLGETDLTLGRGETPTDAITTAVDFCERLVRVVAQLSARGK